MNRRGLPFAVLVWAVLVGCGGTETLPPEEVGSVSEALVTCTATCEGAASVSCTGTTCTATQGSQVTCDGVRTSCPPPASTCTNFDSCSSVHGTACSPRGAERDCSMDGFYPGGCVCLQGRWTCTL
jgi:hypothetical protein